MLGLINNFARLGRSEEIRAMLLSTFLFTWCIIFLVDVTDATYLGSYYTYHNEKAGHRVVRQADFQEFDAHGLLDNKTLLDMALASTIPPADYDVELDKEEVYFYNIFFNLLNLDRTPLLQHEHYSWQ
jgi:hypothetical protein